MYKIVKTEYGLTVFKKETGYYRILSPFEEIEVYKIIPQLNEENTESVIVDILEEGCEMIVRKRELVQ